jgi:tRNA threonylcarbamoyladenosine biosynthesis protein TsaE
VPEWEFVTRSADETRAFGREIAARLRVDEIEKRIRPPVLLLLTGELGAGKTTLAQGIVSGLGAAREDEVTSPTFNLVHVFAGVVKVYHVDLYRVEVFHDLETLGLEDAFDEPGVVLVEWPDRLKFRTDWPIVRIELSHAPQPEPAPNAAVALNSDRAPDAEVSENAHGETSARRIRVIDSSSVLAPPGIERNP